jgi:cation diffusion facilitator family transporter
MLSSIAIVVEAIRSMQQSSPPPDSYTLWIAAVSIVINESFFQYASRVAKKTGSLSVLTSAWDQRLDALSAVAVLAGLALARWGGWHAADHVAAVAVALVVLFAGCKLFWESLQELTDRQADSTVLDAVREEALSVAGAAGVEKLFIRKAGLEYLVDIHLEVAGDLPVRRGHTIGHAVKDRLLDRFVTIKDVLVHIEPAPQGNAPQSE